ncbi:MAG: hypothetical protein KIT84_41120 [Labilithrix sp.]|nr:hypothetical protein [Labilithrix sp.]MCW5817473.1 hypothetical protein [Labilithrix sp.]
MRRLVVFAALLAACKSKVDRVVPAAEAATATATASAAEKAAPPPAPACPAPDAAKIAPFEVDKKVITADVPKLEDPSGSLASFEDKLLALARGTSKKPVRIGFYGDSNLTSDFLTGHLRRSLQGRFGDAGHGFVGLARPWAWYSHEDVHHHGTWPLWKQFDCTTDPVVGHRYGFANMAAESSKPGAAAWAGTAGADAKVGRSVSRFDVYFLKRPRGGSFDLLLDGKLQKTVRTAAADYEAGFETVEAPDGPHEIKCVVKGDQAVRLYGTTLERDDPNGGVVVDSLGAGALNFQRWMLTEPVIRKAQLERRAYDVVFVWLGMNSMWLEPNRGWATDTIKQIRDALPGVPVVLVSPPDSEKHGSQKTDPRIMALVKQLREVAAENDAAFWDFRAAMGGDGAFLEFMKRGLAASDRVHLSREGNVVMGQRLLAALFDDVKARLDAHPDAGCGGR